ncbi:hypothetical protein MMC06_004457 [Schaereria dolodes]|nr:hypothetical protein [Schaereria dolodes]
MQSFILDLSDGGRVTGLLTFPKADPSIPSSHLPLIVAIHGGAYSSSYFFADSEHSALPFSIARGIPLIAINRPGYKDSTPLPSVPSDSSFIREEGKYLHNYVLPAIWKKYAVLLGVSSIVLHMHSFGALGAVIAAALYTDEVKRKTYSLAGLVISGIGTTGQQPDEAVRRLLAKKPPRAALPCGNGDTTMLQTSRERVLDSDSIGRETSDSKTSFAEAYDARELWVDYWMDYATRVGVPVMYALTEMEKYCEQSKGYTQKLAAVFERNYKAERSSIVGAPQATELNYMSKGWYGRVFGFAIECGVAEAMGKLRPQY